MCHLPTLNDDAAYIMTLSMSVCSTRTDITDATQSGADPGFPYEGVSTLQQGHQHIIFTKFSETLHEIENILVRRGGTPGVPPLDPPLTVKPHHFMGQ